MRSLVCLLFLSVFMANSHGADAESTTASLLVTLEEQVKTQPLLVGDLIEEIESRDINNEDQARLLLAKSHLLLLNANYDDALELLVTAENLTKQDTVLTRVYHYQSAALLLLNEYDTALKVIAKNLAKIEKISDEKVKIISYVRLASIYSQLDAYDESLRYALIAKKMSEGEDPHNQCSSMLYVAVAQLYLKAYQQAELGFVQARDFCRANNRPIMAAMSVKGLGMVQFELGLHEAAVPFLLEARGLYQPFNYQYELNSISVTLAEIYLNLGRLNDAYQEASSILSSQQMQESSDSNMEFLSSASGVMAKVSYQRAQYQEAYEYLKKNIQYSDLVLNESKAKAQAYQMAKFDSEEKAREISLLNKERELYISLQQVKEREHTNMLLFVTLLLGGVFFLGVLVVAGLVQKRKYMRMAKIDALTGIYNRGAGQDMGEDAFIQVLTRGEEFGFVLFDLDHFKVINDSYGHGTGDWALKKVAEVIDTQIRNSDIFVRMGGEEFAIMLPFADQKKVLEVAHKCREAIESINTHYSGHDFELTASFGVAHLESSDLSLDPVMHRADIALYCAKSCGRNRIEQYKPEMESQVQSSSMKSKLALS